MKRLQVVFLPLAEREIFDAYEWYRSKSEVATLRFRSELLDVVGRLAESALAYAADESGLRKRRLKGFPYTVRFRANESRVEIASVVHHRRNA